MSETLLGLSFLMYKMREPVKMIAEALSGFQIT